MIAFKQVDVFSNTRFKGNPVAVIMDASTLTDEQMQHIANWTNLSETTFVLPPTNVMVDYRVRIFTPHQELPFAGHPTIGTAHALIEAGLIQVKNGKIIQECGVGLVELTVSTHDDDQCVIAFASPQPKLTAYNATELTRLQQLLNCTLLSQYLPLLIDVGPQWLVVQAPNVAAVLAASPDFVQLAQHRLEQNIAGICLFAFGLENEIEVRSFAPAHDINEDPVCGSGNACVAAFIRHYQSQIIEDQILHSHQGSCLNRDGHLRLQISPTKILVGGKAITCIEGNILTR